MSTELTGKTILMIIAFENFRDEEFLVPFNEFKKLKANVIVASTRKGTARGSRGATFNVDKTVDEIVQNSFDAIVFVGGAGTPTVRSSEKAISLARTASPDKVVAGICWASTILAKAGVLKFKRATVWNGEDDEYNKTTPEVLKQFGATYIADDVVVDGNIITANGAPAAQKFANAIAEVLKKK